MLVIRRIVPYIGSTDEHAVKKAMTLAAPDGFRPGRTNPVEPLKPALLSERMQFALPLGDGSGKAGLMRIFDLLLKYSVNTWHQGFLDKLCASTNGVGVVSDLLLSVLNTNLHVYRVSPALTVIEKATAKTFASMFGLRGPQAGGITCPGGSASNLTFMVCARGAMYVVNWLHTCQLSPIQDCCAPVYNRDKGLCTGLCKGAVHLRSSIYD